MIQNKLILLCILTTVCLVYPAKSADTNAQPVSIAAELRPIIEQIQAKEGNGKLTETNLAAEFQALDALLAKHKADSDAGAQILFIKARIYNELLRDAKSYQAIARQIQNDYPDSKPAAALKRIQQAEQINAQLVPGVPFPDFSATDLSGQAQAVANHKGRVVLVDFWATWCGPCVHELPNVKQVYEKYHDQGFDVIGVSFDSDLDKLKDYIDDQKLPWPQIFDLKETHHALGDRYGVSAIPSTFLIDRDGKLIAKNVRGEALEPAVAKALAK